MNKIKSNCIARVPANFRSEVMSHLQNMEFTLCGSAAFVSLGLLNREIHDYDFIVSVKDTCSTPIKAYQDAVNFFAAAQIARPARTSSTRTFEDQTAGHYAFKLSSGDVVDVWLKDIPGTVFIGGKGFHSVNILNIKDMIESKLSFNRPKDVEDLIQIFAHKDFKSLYYNVIPEDNKGTFGDPDALAALKAQLEAEANK